MKSRLSKRNFRIELFSKESKKKSNEPLQLVMNIIFNNNRIVKKNHSNDEKQKRKRNFQEKFLHQTISNLCLFNNHYHNTNNYINNANEENEKQYDKQKEHEQDQYQYQENDQAKHSGKETQYEKEKEKEKQNEDCFFTKERRQNQCKNTNADQNININDNKNNIKNNNQKFYATSFTNFLGSLTQAQNDNCFQKINNSGNHNHLTDQFDVYKSNRELSEEIPSKTIEKNSQNKIKGNIETTNGISNLKINNNQIINFKKNSISHHANNNQNQESINYLQPNNLKASSSMRSQDKILGPFNNYQKESLQNSRLHILSDYAITNKAGQKSNFFHHIKTINQRTPSNYQVHHPLNYNNSLHHNFVASIPQILSNNYTSILSPSSIKNKQDVLIKEIQKDQNKTSYLVKDLIKAGQTPTNFKINKELFYTNYSSKELKSHNSKRNMKPWDVDTKKKEMSDIIQIYQTNANVKKGQRSLPLTKSLKVVKNNNESPMILSKEDINKMLKAFTRSSSKNLKITNMNKVKSIIIHENKNTSGLINSEANFIPINIESEPSSNSLIFAHRNKNLKEEKGNKLENITSIESFSKIAKVTESSPSPQDKINLEKISLSNEKERKEIDDFTEYKHTERFLKERTELISLIKSFVAKNKKCPPTTLQYYRIGRCLGKGGFGKVYLGIHKLSGKYVAIKTFCKDRLKDKASYEKIYREISILKILKHKSITRLFETFESEKSIQLVCELCVGGDLLEYVRKRRKLSEEYGKFIMKQILKGVYHCHINNILHRDLKLDNILLNAKGEIKVN